MKTHLKFSKDQFSPYLVEIYQSLAKVLQEGNLYTNYIMYINTLQFASVDYFSLCVNKLMILRSTKPHFFCDLRPGRWKLKLLWQIGEWNLTKNFLVNMILFYFHAILFILCVTSIKRSESVQLTLGSLLTSEFLPLW